MAPNLLGSTAIFLAEATTTGQEDSTTLRKTATTALSQLSTDPTTSTSYSKPSTSSSSLTTTSVTQRKYRPDYEWKIVWRNVIAFLYLHISSLYGLYLMFTVARGYTNLWAIFYAYLAGMGITAGAHRLWAHRAYKAKWPLRLILCLLQTMAFQNHIYEWVRDHRVHHKFTDTDADPHNANRGFFFSHIGWLMVKKHKDVVTKGKTVDMSDLESDPIIIWQKRTYLVIMPILCFFFPAWVPYYFWNEDPYVAWYVAAITRYTLSLNGTWLVNSAAHIWGTKPFDKSISPTDNVNVAVFAFGEGWHNYHHVFPWDYKAAELGNYRSNFTTAFIDMFAKIGWAYDLKTVPVSMVLKRLNRTGDGTHVNHGKIENVETKTESEAIQSNNNNNNNNNNNLEAKVQHYLHHNHHLEHQIWGWGDKDMQDSDIKDAEIINPSTELLH